MHWVSWWIHLATFLSFGVYLTFSKHMHLVLRDPTFISATLMRWQNQTVSTLKRQKFTASIVSKLYHGKHCSPLSHVQNAAAVIEGYCPPTILVSHYNPKKYYTISRTICETITLTISYSSATNGANLSRRKKMRKWPSN